MGIFLWAVFPYIAASIMIFGLLYRFVNGPKSWAAPSTEFFEKKWLRLGSPLFHYGIIFAFVGHIMGVVMPKQFYEFLGIPDETYHLGAVAGGAVAGFMVVIGLVILLIRKLRFSRVRVHASFADYFALSMVLIVSAIGTYITAIHNTLVFAFDYRSTISPWFRSLFIFQPQYTLMEGIPLIFKVHVVSAFLLFAALPFTMLVHLFSFPARYPTRAPIQYRSRVGYRKSKVK